MQQVASSLLVVHPDKFMFDSLIDALNNDTMEYGGGDQDVIGAVIPLSEVSNLFAFYLLIVCVVCLKFILFRQEHWVLSSWHGL